MVTPPPGPAVIVAGGLGWNLARSHRNRARREHGDPTKATICRWACRHKPAAVTAAVGFGSWLIVHVARYVIEQP